MSGIAYRSEIDGLRAIAVLSVVLYHAGFGPRAGFVGVDVFFVISGYLITALLHKEWTLTGRIDLSGFYARRVRRIFPALIVVVIGTITAAIVLLPPYSDQLEVMRSAVSSLLFAANFFFQSTTGGYFDGNSDLLPLMHLWSLGVEEQFYLLWPIALIVLLRRPKSLTPTVALLSVASLALAEFLVRTDPSAAFYQMPARFWELAMGGLIALRPSGQLRNAQPAAMAGLIGVLAACAIPIPHFPGLGALPAVAGAAVLLYAVHGSRQLGLAGAWLRSPPMVFFGLISYSLYLWHWPLLAFDRATRIGPSPLLVRVLLIVSAVVLAWLSYRFVERPLRRPDPGTTNQRVVAAGVLASASLAFFVWTLGNFLHQEKLPNDLASRTSRDMPENRVQCNYRGDESLNVFPKPDCNSVPGKPVRVAIWGDSHALAWQPMAWAIARQHGVAATSFTRDACAPALDYDNGKSLLEARRCREFNALTFNLISGIDTLILSARWPDTLDGGDFRGKFEATVQRLAPRVRKIILLGPTPYLHDTALRCIESGNLAACAVGRREFDEVSDASRKWLASIAAQYANVEYVDLGGFFCNSDVCPVLKDGYALYWDSNHVSSTAARNFTASYLGSGAATAHR